MKKLCIYTIYINRYMHDRDIFIFNDFSIQKTLSREIKLDDRLFAQTPAAGDKYSIELDIMYSTY